MANTDQIIEYLEEHEQAICDDCLSEILHITPRQQVNAICRRLQSDGLILRSQGICPSCQRGKLTNRLQAGRPLNDQVKALAETRLVPQASRTLASPTVRNIEEIRTHIVRFCRELWKAKTRGEPAHGAGVISALRDKGIVPAHPANMMLTLCALRNCYSYEQLSLGANEMSVIQGAWSIVESWASSSYSDLWQRTARSS